MTPPDLIHTATGPLVVTHSAMVDYGRDKPGQTELRFTVVRVREATPTAMPQEGQG